LQDSSDFYFSIQLDSALAYATRLGALASAVGDSVFEMEALMRKGLLNLWMGNMELAQANLENALRFEQGLGSAQIKAQSLRALGNLYVFQDSRLEGLEYYRQAEELIPQLSDAILIGRIHFGIADLYFTQRDYATASEYYHKALEAQQQVGDSIGMAKAWLNLGKLAIQFDSLGMARQWYEAAGEVFSEQGNNFWLGTLVAHMGKLLVLEGQPRSALASFDSALVLSEPYYNVWVQLTSWHGKAEAYWQLGNYAEARKFAQQEIAKAIEIGEGSRLLDGQSVLQRILISEGRLREALELADLQMALSDSLQRVESLQEVQWLEGKYQRQRERDSLTYAQHAEVLQLKKDTERAQLLNKVTLWGLLVVLAFLGAFWFTLVRVRRARKHAQEQEQISREQAQDIKAQNDLMEEQQAKIIQQRDQLKDSNEIKNTIFSIISHDLRSPLSSLNNMVVLLQSGVQLSSTEMDKILNQLGGSVKGLLHSLDNLLRWSLNQMEKPYTVQPDDLKVAALIKESELFFAPLFLAKHLAVQGLASEECLRVFADENSIRLVLRNLISNAIKFTPRGGQITLGATTVGDQVEIWVEDTGMGLSDELLATLFRGYVDSKLGTENEKGTGLGLSLCQDFVHMNGGEIGAENTEQGGARFWFRLPMVNVQAATLSNGV